MLFSIPSLDEHMGTMRKRNANHTINMMHIDASHIILWIRIIKKGEVSKMPFFKTCPSVRFDVFSFFHRGLTLIYSSIVEMGRERKGMG